MVAYGKCKYDLTLTAEACGWLNGSSQLQDTHLSPIKPKLGCLYYGH